MKLPAPTQPGPRPASHLAHFFLAAFALLAVTLGYYTIAARLSLTTRPDNPRALIAYNRVQRGQILDRNGLPLARTTGSPGSYVREYAPSAALVTGYASFTYGLSGIEQYADPALTGLAGLDDLTRWWRHDVLNEPVIGHDIQLTLDLALQRAAFDALGRHAGAVVILDIPSGDILALASAPSFDPARLEAEFERIAADSGGPLINRATVGVYRAEDVLSFFPRTLDLAHTPVLPIPTSQANGSRISPLHLALLVAAVTNDGLTPAPRLLLNAASLDRPVSILAQSQLQPSIMFSATVASGFEDETLGWYAAADGRRAIVIVLEDATAADGLAVRDKFAGALPP